MNMTTLGIAAGLVATVIGPVAGARDDEPKDGGAVELVIGRLLPEEGGNPDADPGPLHRPFGVDFMPDGTMIIVELEGGRVHAMGPDGAFRTIAGDGSTGYEGDGGPAREATFNGMHNVAVTPDGAILIADSWNHCVRRIDPEDGTIATIAGTGAPGNSGDGGPASEATFDFIMCITLDPDGDRLDLADLRNRRVRSVDLDTGLVSAVAGNGEKGVPADGAKATEAPLVDPRAVAADSKGNIYILERGGHALRRVDPDGTIHTVAGTGTAGFRDGPALDAQFRGPKHIAVGPDDSVYIADDENAAIRRYDPATGTVSTVLGRGEGSPTIRLLHPHGVCIEGDLLYVVDTGHDRIFRMPLPGASSRSNGGG